MSDNWIIVIPRDPNFIPPTDKITQAKLRFGQITPNADGIEVIVEVKPQFFDAGANFSSIACPSCSKKIPLDWWQERMNEDFEDDGFVLVQYRVPCCSQEHDLNSLEYDWNQGFAKFAIDAMNPGIAELEEADRKELENILGTPLKVIYQHI